MNKEAWKVFFACALGAGIGTLVALEMSLYFWWVGLIAGGLVGYLAYKPMKIVKAIPGAIRAAARQTALVTRSEYYSLRTFLATPKLGRTMLYTSVVYASVALWPLGLVLVLGLTNSKVNWDPQEIWLGIGFVFSLAGLGLLMSLSGIRKTGSGIEDMKGIAYAVFPPIVICYHLPRGLWWLMRHGLPRATVATAKLCWVVIRFWIHFIRFLFLYIHSELRLLCLVDATIGAAVGFFAGSVIIGALSGGVWGLINYLVITKRILEPRGYLPLGD